MEVDGDAEGCSQLIVASISLANRGTRVIHPAGDAKVVQSVTNFLHQRLEIVV